MRSYRAVTVVAGFLCVVVVIYGGPILRLRFGWSVLVISAVQLVCAVLVLVLVGREVYRQASKSEAPGSKPRLVNVIGVAVLTVALAAAMFVGRRA
jgi:hypothetical protein